LMQASLKLQQAHGWLPEPVYQRGVASLEKRLTKLLAPTYPQREEEKVAQRFRNQREPLFTFLHHPEVEATHNLAERQLRPAVIARKLSGGNATERGARTLEVLALHDPLTELHNRRFMNDRLPAEVARAARTKNELAIAIVDLDEFKPINDTLGHASGDRALRAFARALSTGLRSYDLVCRFGGDEFVVLFPDCGAAGARTALSQFRSRRSWALADVPVVTFSAGIAEFPRDGRLLEELFEAADKNLRLAKQLGRDNIVGPRQA